MTERSRERLLVVLFVAHLAALVFGLIGLLIMLPNPDLWVGDPNAVRVFDFSMEYAGSIHILLGAAAMFMFGVFAIGWRKTLIFAVVSCSLSLSSELIGTGTGWPFGNYAYTDFLGTKVMGRVPYTIPFSWFYMGLAAYIMGAVVAKQLKVRNLAVWSSLLGATFLTVWDLVLDPAMASETLRIKFWVWEDGGAYYGMPFKNLIGWSVTGLLFMAISRIFWRDDIHMERLPWLPAGVYLANLAFAVVISANVGLWVPILLALALGAIPTVVIWGKSGPAFLSRRRKLAHA
ncbi:carotenoid biosynthesis protein [soil metagenome]